MNTLHSVLMIAAIICFLAAALGVQAPRGNLVAGGLALWATAALLG